ncbi:MAG: D-alanyl-D-alanine carboxypeptidase [Clostridia bacterium]|nr:D-alanyl-D-alanine carboxypeptidase [Clostridia bacterium]
MLLACFSQAETPNDFNLANPDLNNPTVLLPGHLYGRSCILINADNGEVLFEKDADTRRYPASTTKIMTCILALEYGPELDETITIPAGIGVDSESSKMGITAGDRMSFGDLLYGMMLASGNDAAIAVAILISGTEAAFVQLMNNKAVELGLSQNSTHFNNVHGLHHANHYTTARDLAVISAYAMRNSDFRDIVGCLEHTVYSNNWPDGKVFKTKYDIMVPGTTHYYQYCIGIKTGYTNQAGRSFVGAAKKDSLTLIAVSLLPDKIDSSDKTYTEAFQDNKRMFMYGFQLYQKLSFSELCALCDSSLLSYKVENAATDDGGNGSVEVSIGIGSEYSESYLKSEINDPLKSDNISRSFVNRLQITLNDDVTDELGRLKAPLTKNQVIGTARFEGLDGRIYNCDVVSSRDISERPISIEEQMDSCIKASPVLRTLSPKYTPVIWLLYVLLVALIVILIYAAHGKQRRRNKARRAAYEQKKREYLRRMQQQNYNRRTVSRSVPERSGAVRSASSAAKRTPSAHPDKRASGTKSK